MSVYLQQKGYKRFIDFHSCDMWLAEESEPEEQEVRYRQRKAEIEAMEDNEARVNAMERLDTLFHSDLGRWSAAKHKAKESWKREEEMARGCILSAVSESYKLLLKNCKTTFEMWEALKRE